MTAMKRNPESHGRRREDGRRFRFTAKRALTWALFLSAMIGLWTWAVNTVGAMVVTPPAMKEVQDSLGSFRKETRDSIALLRGRVDSVKVRVDTLDRRMGRVEDVVESVAIDLCLRNRTNRAYYAKLKCARILSEVR